MIVLLAHQVDPWAPGLARRVAELSGGPVGVMTPRDLSRRGWALASPPGAPTDRMVVDGEIMAASEASLVVSLLDDVYPAELVWIREQDAEYVAAEMAAFLRYWMTSVSGQVLVPPGDQSLAGPDAPLAAWARAAGVPVAGRAGTDGDLFREVAVTGGVVTGAAAPALRRAVTAMAAWAGVPWLRAFFAAERDELVSVVPLPALADATHQAAVVIAAAHRGRRAA
ncbi:hypothetical protein [Tessaracoccus sp. G1721]